MLKNKSLLLKLYALLAVLESAIAFYYLASIPSDTGNAMFAGYSLSRLLLFACALIPFIVFGIVLLAATTSLARSNQLIVFVDNLLVSEIKHLFIDIAAFMLILFSVLFLLVPSDSLDNFAVIFERLSPLIYLGGCLGAQTLLVQFLWRDPKIYFQNLKQWRSIFLVTGILLASVVVVSAWVAWSGVGLKPEVYGWHTPGTPVPFVQLSAALFLTLLFIFSKSRIEAWYLNLWRGKSPSLKFETVIFLILWLTAFLVWRAEPMLKQSYFTPEPTAPNFEYYPYSDAGFYDTTSQSILIGEGRNLTTVLRPLYIFFLTILHIIGGQNYEAVLTLQVLSLAVMPALVFLLVSLLGNQSAGVLAAILVIFREKNSIALTNVIEVSHSKLLLSDLPTMAFVLLLVYALVNWLRKTDNDYLLGLIAGAAFGLVVLVRSQAQLLLPILLVGIVFSGGFQWRKALQRGLIFSLGLLIVVTPWVWRNYQVSGTPAVENTGFYIRLFAGGYSEPDDVVDILPGESNDEYNARIRSQIIRYVFNHPLEIARIYSSYFIHNEISSVIYLPMSFKLYGPHAYVDQVPFWDDPYIDLANGYGVMFFLTLALIALGVASAFERLGFLGLFPLLIHLTYSFSVVIARISGWRFVMPVDWILQVYYSIGLIQLVVMIVSVVWNRKLAVDTGGNDSKTAVAGHSFFQRKTYLAMTGFLLIGLSLPAIELAMPVRYPRMSQIELVDKYVPEAIQLDNAERVTASALKMFLETEPGATVLYGRVLYPSYYEQGEFWGDSNEQLLEASQYTRLQFSMIGGGSNGAFVVIPLQEPPQYFPHASDVFVVGCSQETSVRALITVVNGRVLAAAPWYGLTCSVTE